MRLHAQYVAGIAVVIRIGERWRMLGVFPIKVQTEKAP